MEDLHHYLRRKFTPSHSSNSPNTGNGGSACQRPLHKMPAFAERGKDRQFSILPLASRIAPGHIDITSSCLGELLRAGQKEWRERGKEAAWRASFSLGALETGGRRFALFISTDGYAAPMLLTKQRLPPSTSPFPPSLPLPTAPQQRLVGIDPGVRTLAACYASDGKQFNISTSDGGPT